MSDEITDHDEDDEDEAPDTYVDNIDGHSYVIRYDRTLPQIHANDCEKCARLRDLDGILARAIEALPKDTDLRYVEYDDQLSDRQISALLEGRASEVESDLDDAWSDSAWRNEEDMIKQVLPDEDERDALEDSEKHLQKLRDEIRERDQSDPLLSLIRSTPRVLLRYDLGNNTGDPDLWQGSWSWDEDRVKHMAYRLLQRLRLSPKAVYTSRSGRQATNLQQMMELVTEASGGGFLQVIWNADVEDILRCTLADTFGTPVPRYITWRDPRILLINTMEGSGHEVTLSGSITRIWNPDRCYVDSQFGYGWDSICGLVKSAYDDDPTIRPLPDKI